MSAAGILMVAPGGEILLLRRAPDEPNFGGHWALPGGRAEPGETHEECARREAREELGWDDFGGDLVPLDEVPIEDGTFVTFLQRTSGTLAPQLDHEHTDFVWARPEALPTPMHPGVAATLRKIVLAQDEAPRTVALDRASVRRTDADGHLHVARTPISKANICPYYGREIPDSEALGLDPARLYRLLRHPDELARAAASFAGKPLLRQHTSVGADDHPADKVVGAIGTEVLYEHPYLTAPLSVWDGESIRDIEADVKRQLSSGYRYRADMTPGTYEGQSYDGVMRDIGGNHVALVVEGRAGPDVVVGDQAVAETEEPDGWGGKFADDSCDLTRDEWSEEARRKAAEARKGGGGAKTEGRHGYNAQGVSRAISTHNRSGRGKIGKKEASTIHRLLKGRSARDRRAADSSLSNKENDNMPKILLTRKAALAQGAIMTYLAPLLAQDAAVDLKPLLAEVTAAEWKRQRGPLAAGIVTATTGKLMPGAALDGLPGLLKALDAVDPDEEDKKAEDEDDEDDEKKGAEDEQDDDEQEAMDEDKADEDEKAKTAKDRRKAMDAAVARAVEAAVGPAVKRAEKAVAERLAGVRKAEDEVAPYVGRLALAHDTAEGVYRTALGALGVDTEGVHPSALRAILKAQPLPGVAQRVAPAMAQDEKSVSSFQAMFPEASKHVVRTI